MAAARRVAANQFRRRRWLGSHRLDIEMENETRMVDAVEKVHRLGTAIDEIRLLRCEWLQAEFYTAIRDAGESAAKSVGSVLRCLFARRAGRYAPLSRRTKN